MLYLHCKMFRSPYNKWLAKVICYVAQNIFLECTIFVSQIYTIFRWSPQRHKTAVLVDSFKIILPHDFMTPHSQALMTVTDFSSPHSPPSPPCCYNSQQEIKMNRMHFLAYQVSGKAVGKSLWERCNTYIDIITRFLTWHHYKKSSALNSFYS